MARNHNPCDTGRMKKKASKRGPGALKKPASEKFVAVTFRCHPAARKRLAATARFYGISQGSLILQALRTLQGW